MVLTLPAACVVENAEEIRQSLLALLADPGDAVLEFQEVRQVDMSFFQLLVAARLSFSRTGRPLAYTETLPPFIADEARLAGFHSLTAFENIRPKEAP